MTAVRHARERLTMTVAEEVRQIAIQYGVKVDSSSRAYRMAVAVNRLEGIEGDETLDLLATLSRLGHVTREQAVGLVLRHAREYEPSVPAEFSQDALHRQVQHGLGSVRR